MKSKQLIAACFLIIMSGLWGCQGEASQSTKPPSQPENRNAEGLKMNPKYPNIPLAEKGITVVNPDGWNEQQMEFHLNYCNQMISGIEDVDPDSFCQCFLSKIQYYYEPRFFKEAYEDQEAWNQLCFQNAQSGGE